jgi:hypothetical protein
VDTQSVAKEAIRSNSTHPAFVAAFVARTHRGNALNSIAVCRTSRADKRLEQSRDRTLDLRIS